MGGETEKDVSGWTVDTLHAHVMKILAERDLRFQQRFDAQQHALTAVPPLSEQIAQVRTRLDGFDDLMEAKFVTYRTLIDSQADKVRLALTSVDREKAADKEYIREALGSRDRLISVLTDRVRELELARSSGAGGEAGVQAKVTDQRAFIATAVGILGVLITLIIIVANILPGGGV